jgi:hypothetical protein
LASRVVIEQAKGVIAERGWHRDPGSVFSAPTYARSHSFLLANGA